MTLASTDVRRGTAGGATRTRPPGLRRLGSTAPCPLLPLLLLPLLVSMMLAGALCVSQARSLSECGLQPLYLSAHAFPLLVV